MKVHYLYYVCYLFMGFDKFMFCIHHYGIIRSSFTVLKIPCTSPIHPEPQTLGNHWSFYHLFSFAFSRVSYNWNPIICSLWYWLLFQQYAFNVLLCFCGLLVSIYCWITSPCFVYPPIHCLSSYSFVLVTFSFWWLRIKLQ